MPGLVCQRINPSAMQLHMVAMILLIIGGINWLLVGLLGTDVGELLFGGMDMAISRIIYILVGLAALYELFTFSKRA